MKKLNFVYNYMTPNGPITNQLIPDLGSLLGDVPQSRKYRAQAFRLFKHDQVVLHCPFYYSNIGPTWVSTKANNQWYTLPKEHFIYDIGGRWPDGHFTSEFYPGEGIWDRYNHPIEIRDRLIQGTAHVLFYAESEAWCDKPTMDVINSYWDNLGIPRTSVIYLTNAPNAEQLMQEWYGDNHIQMAYPGYFRHQEYRTPYTNLPKEYKPGPRKKLFLCWNRNLHEHRVWMYLTLYKQNLLDKFYISFPSKSSVRKSDSFVTVADSCLKNNSFDQGNKLKRLLNIEDEDVMHAGGSLPKVLDSFNLNDFNRINSSSGVEEFYANSLIHVVPETIFFGELTHVTEKTWKAINFLQPFIVLATPGHLAYLRSIGFKTFYDFWDESYDDIGDHILRLKAIMDVISQIATWTEAQQVEFSHAVKPIVDYNLMHYQTLGPIESDAFVERFGV
jgi:hypothetical protein